jgi:hypothetical protein
MMLKKKEDIIKLRNNLYINLKISSKCMEIHYYGIVEKIFIDHNLQHLLSIYGHHQV